LHGAGILHYSDDLNYFDLQEPIRGVANAVGVERKVYKIVSSVKKDSHGQSVTEQTREPLADGATLTSGDIIETELYLKSDNDYSYIVIEDMKPAGCEPVELRSGGRWVGGLCANFELRDEKVVFFIALLEQGQHILRYKMRAETPGVFHVLPTSAGTMYAPEIRAISDEMRLGVRE